MRAIGKWLGVVFVTVVALAVTLFTISRTRGAPPEQRAALALMSERPAMPGRNAFAALWLLRFDVPEAQQEAIAAADARRFARAPQPSPAGSASLASSAASGHADLTSGIDRNLACTDDCLAQVRARPQDYADWTRRHARLVERVASLSQYGHYRNSFAARLDMPFPDFRALPVARTAHAVAFVQGDRDTALAAVCRDAGTWRRLLPNSDSLIVSMVAANEFDRSVRLFADMLAELPAGHPLPATCSDSFATPSPADGSVCAAMKGEFAFVDAAASAALEQSGSPFYDRAMTSADSALRLSHPCRAEAAQALAADRPMRTPPVDRSFARLECVANYGGCILGAIAAPAYVDYLHRGQDHRARVRVAAALLHLHARGGSADMLAGLPPALRAGRPLALVDGGTALRIALFETRRGAHWQVPLPSSRVAAVSPSSNDGVVGAGTEAGRAAR